MSFFGIINPLYSLSGLAVGALVGLTGVGGGSLMTPLLVLLFGIHPATAVGTDLLYASLTKTTGTLVHAWSGSVDWRIVRRLASGSVPATALVLGILSQMGERSPEVSALITSVLGGALIVTAISLIFRRRLLDWAHGRLGEMEPGRVRWLTILTGALLGTMVSLTSVGAGAIGVTVLLLLYPRLPTVRIVGSDIAHAVPLTFVAGIGHWYLGSVDMALLLSLLVGSIPGIVLGSLASHRIPEGILRPILAATLALVGGRLLA